MPTPQQYATAAERQRAYRLRQAQARQQERHAKGLPPAPALATLPGERRWAALVEHARAALASVQAEMQGYYDARSEAWQDSERGEALQERMDALDSLLTDMDTFAAA